MNKSGQKAGESEGEPGRRAQRDGQPPLNRAAVAAFDVGNADGGLVTSWLLHQAGPSEDSDPNYDAHLVCHLAERRLPGAA